MMNPQMQESLRGKNLYPAEIAAVEKFRQDLVAGVCLPSGAIGNGLYPNDWKPLLTRAAEAIESARAGGETGTAHRIIYCKDATGLAQLEAAMKPGVEMRTMPETGHHRDHVVVLFKR